MFYTKKIYLLEEVPGYVDDYGVYHEAGEEIKKSIKCDVQPYSTERLYRDYGYNDKVTQRVFCDKDEDIKTGIKCLYQGKKYVVTRVIEWDDYMELMIYGEE